MFIPRRTRKGRKQAQLRHTQLVRIYPLKVRNIHVLVYVCEVVCVFCCVLVSVYMYIRVSGIGSRRVRYCISVARFLDVYELQHTPSAQLTFMHQQDVLSCYGRFFFGAVSFLPPCPCCLVLKGIFFWFILLAFLLSLLSS